MIFLPSWFGAFRVAFPSSVSLRLPPSPEGKALVWCNCKGPYDHQGSALEARKQGELSPPCSVSRTRLRQHGTRLPIIGNKGVLRTIGSKSTFAYFSLTRKVGRRRQNTKQYTVGYRQRSPILRQRKNKKSRCRERRVVVKQYNSKRVKTLCFQGTA